MTDIRGLFTPVSSGSSSIDRFSQLLDGEKKPGSGIGLDPIESSTAVKPGDGRADDDLPIATTLAIGEEDGGAPIVEPQGILGTNGDDALRGTNKDDRITTGQGDDVVRARRGDDTIVVDGTGDKDIRGGRGNDTVELQGASSDYTIEERRNRFIYTAPDGSQISLRNIETVVFSGSGESLPPGVSRPVSPDPSPTPVFPIAGPGSPIGGPEPVPTLPPVLSPPASPVPDPIPVFPPEEGPNTPTGGPVTVPFPFLPTGAPAIGTFQLAPNSIGATEIVFNGSTATLSGPNTNFVFTGVQSLLAVDGPITATGGSGVINGVETTAVPISENGTAVLSLSSGFTVDGNQSVTAAFANGAELSTIVDRPSRDILPV